MRSCASHSRQTHQWLQEVEQRGKSVAQCGVLVQQHLDELDGQLGRVEATGQLLQQANLDL